MEGSVRVDEQYGAQTEVRDASFPYPYLQYLPQDFQLPADSGDRWPLLLFLHGAGESGTGLKAEMLAPGATGSPMCQLEAAADGYSETDGTKHQCGALLRKAFVVVSPQTARSWKEGDLLAFTQRLLASDVGQRLDTSRLYVTGLSAGGAGAFNAALTKLFAAVVAVCPAKSAGDWCQKLQGTPTWILHGENDTIVGIERSAGVEKRCQRYGITPPVIFTRYARSPAPVGYPRYKGHASWMQAYEGDDVFRWLLEHQLNT
jgi:predicted peptidase